MHKPILYLIASPVGNLRDISMRALDILAQTPLLAAEDTRRARQLLAAHGIGGKKVMSLRAHNESRAAQELIRQMQTAKQAAYLSDAGTPGISDPGAKLVRMARAAQIRISSVPGASALTCLLAAAGTESAVHFFGFPPRAAAARKSFLATNSVFRGRRRVVRIAAPDCDTHLATARHFGRQRARCYRTRNDKTARTN